jgi:hypothetical protein
MSHKAHAFDWDRFETELLPILERALTNADTRILLEFVSANRDHCRDPYEGEELPLDWDSQLEIGDVQEFADFALTKYYDPSGDFGVHEHWNRLDDELPKPARNALLGFPVGPAGFLFDPGAMGAYFQTPSMIVASLAALESHRHPELQIYMGLLHTITQSRAGLYVTF